MEKGTKYLYETVVKQEFEEQVKESRVENGQTVEVSKPVKKIKDVKVAILQPDRKLYKSAEVFFAVTLSNYLKLGLMPHSLVAKRYANDGGPLTEAEKSRLEELRLELRTLEKEFFVSLETNSETQKRKADIILRINEINTEISSIQNAYSDIFDNTADVKARNDTIEWWTLSLTYIDEDGKGYKPLFGDSDYDGKVKKLEHYEDLRSPFYNEIIQKLSYLISFWFTARTALTRGDFETMERLYLDTSTNYKVGVEEPEVEQVKLEILPETAETKVENAAPTEQSTI